MHFEKGHSRQCPSLRCKEHYMILFVCFKSVKCLYQLSGIISVFISTADERRSEDCGHQFLTAVNEGFH